MKKILITISVLFFLISNSYADYNTVTYVNTYKLTTSDKIIVNKLSNKINSLLSKNSLAFRSKLENRINEIQYEYKASKKLHAIFQEIKINTHLISYKEEYTKHYKDFNIDIDKVKKTWLDWHNKARSDLGRNLYSYDERLDNTSYEWSKYQNGVNIMSHKRSPDGPYYDYAEIEKWFTDRGVKCEVKGGATSSESIGKFGYYCRDGECTDELIKSLKTIFDIFMNEKGLPYPANAHYKGITHQDLSKIGIGISIEQKYHDEYKDYKSYDYYITTHYCTSFKK